MLAIHFVCVGRLNLHVVEHPIWESGDWDLTSQEAARLVGGMPYLHETKADPSYFGGRITAFRLIETDRARPRRIVFKLEALRQGTGIPGRGQDHARAWTSGIIDDADEK